MLASRPRSSSGIVSFQIRRRKMPLRASAPPATARLSSASQRAPLKPKAIVPSPHAAAASTTARPCRCTCEAQPLVAVASSAPAAGAL
jgi:hypothetical protein